MKRVMLESAVVLHRRPYRETSFLVDIFTGEHGRLTVLAKGVRKAKSSTQGLLQPFTPLLMSWTGKGELMTLIHVEAAGAPQSLQGECLFAGFYLNELMMGLLQKWDAQPGIFKRYQETIAKLQGNRLEQKVLRSFEKYLLEELGYRFLPKSDSDLQATFSAEKYYRFVPEEGFVISDIGDLSQAKSYIFSGKSLLAIAKEDWDEADSLQDAKRLMRFILTPLLGSRPIYSRQLFGKLQEETQYE